MTPPADIPIDWQALDALRGIAMSEVAQATAKACPPEIWPEGPVRELAAAILFGNVADVRDTPEARAYLWHIEQADPDIWTDGKLGVRCVMKLCERAEGEGSTYARLVWRLSLGLAGLMAEEAGW